MEDFTRHSEKRIMKKHLLPSSRARALILAILGGLCAVPTAQAQWSWNSSGSGTNTSIPANVSSGSGANSWIYNWNGTYVLSANTNGASVSLGGSPWPRAKAHVYVITSGTASASGTAVGNAWSAWSWTGSPGSSTSVVVQLTANLNGRIDAQSYSSGTNSSQSSQSSAWANGDGTASANYGTTVSQSGGALGQVWTDVDNGVVSDVIATLTPVNATMTNTTDSEINHGTNATAYAGFDYSVSLGQRYNTTAGISSFSLSAQLYVGASANAWASGGEAYSSGVSQLSGTAYAQKF